MHWVDRSRRYRTSSRRWRSTSRRWHTDRRRRSHLPPRRRSTTSAQMPRPRLRHPRLAHLISLRRTLSGPRETTTLTRRRTRKTRRRCWSCGLGKCTRTIFGRFTSKSSTTTATRLRVTRFPLSLVCVGTYGIKFRNPRDTATFRRPFELNPFRYSGADGTPATTLRIKPALPPDQRARGKLLHPIFSLVNAGESENNIKTTRRGRARLQSLPSLPITVRWRTSSSLSSLQVRDMWLSQRCSWRSASRATSPPWRRLRTCAVCDRRSWRVPARTSGEGYRMTGTSRPTSACLVANSMHPLSLLSPTSSSVSTDFRLLHGILHLWSVPFGALGRGKLRSGGIRRHYSLGMLWWLYRRRKALLRNLVHFRTLMLIVGHLLMKVVVTLGLEALFLRYGVT